MRRLSRLTANRLLIALGCIGLSAVPSSAQVSIRSVKLLGAKNAVEIEVETSERIVPQTQVLTGPDRLVVDFPNSIPGADVRSQSVDRGDVKDVRVGLFQSKPPVTRVVLDLKAARSYQIFPSGRTVTIKVMGGEAADVSAANYAPAQQRPGFVAANYTTRAEPVLIAQPERPGLDVSFRNGLLGIRANKVTLSEVLFAVQQRTGADISIPAGAEQERVAVEIEPAPAPEVLARLLNGSRFNFLILSGVDDSHQLARVILSPRLEGGFVPPPMEPPVARAPQNDEEQPDVAIANQPNGPTPTPMPPGQEVTPSGEAGADK
jgi:AMIN domain